MYRGISRILLAATVGVAAMFANTGVFAQTADALLHPGVNQLSDDTGEILVNKNGSGATTVDVGDVFLAVIGINTINGTVVGGASPNNELTGIFALQVTSVNALPAAACFGAASCSSFTFAPVADIQAEFTAAGFVGVPAAPANTLALVFEDAANNYSISGGDFQTLINTAVGGTQRMVLTFNPGGITAVAPADLLDFVPLAQGAPVGSLGGQAIIVSESFALDFLPTVQVIGNISKPNANEQFAIRDDITFTLVTVPEPMTASLLGSGLLMLGLLALRRRKDERAE
jgi:hypothetical protein